jgi:hypothetical protein
MVLFEKFNDLLAGHFCSESFFGGEAKRLRGAVAQGLRFLPAHLFNFPP